MRARCAAAGAPGVVPAAVGTRPCARPPRLVAPWLTRLTMHAPQALAHPGPFTPPPLPPPPARRIIILVKAGAPVDATVAQLSELLEAGDIIVDGGNEWCAKPASGFTVAPALVCC